MVLLLLLVACRPGEGTVVDRDTVDDSGTEATVASGSTGTTGSTGTMETGLDGRPPNVLILLSDDQGVDKVGSYGEHPIPPKTPVLDALAARGVSFDRAYAYPSCSPSRGALLTGKQAHRTGLGAVIQYFDDEELPPDTFSLPRMLDASPWAWETAAFGKWHLSSYQSASGIQHPLLLGFGRFTGNMGNLQDPHLEPNTRHNYTFWDKLEDGQLSVETAYATTVTVDAAIEAVQTLPEPWLVYVPLHAPHTPLHIPPAHLADPVNDALDTRDLYDALVQAMDTEIGRLLDAVDEEETLVIFASDNGTSTHGARPPTDPNRVKLTAFEGGIRVPLIVAGPGVATGRRSDALVHLVDVLPTVAEVAGVDLSGEDLDGLSLWPQLTDPLAAGRPVLHSGWYFPNGQGSQSLGGEKWITHDARFKVAKVERGPIAILDLQEDPLEKAPYLAVEDLPEEHQARVQALLESQEKYFEGIEMVTW